MELPGYNDTVRPFAVRSSLWMLLLTLGPASSALACRTSNNVYIISLNGYMARGYGHVSALLAAGALYFQIRRAGWNVRTAGLALLVACWYPLNPGWHYSGIHGDCGFGEVGGAHQEMFHAGALLAWQIVVALLFFWRRKTSILR